MKRWQQGGSANVTYMQKWEYHFWLYDPSRLPNQKPVDPVNELGEKGWELVAASIDEYMRQGLWFKRPKQ